MLIWEAPVALHSIAGYSKSLLKSLIDGAASQIKVGWLRNWLPLGCYSRDGTLTELFWCEVYLAHSHPRI